MEFLKNAGLKVLSGAVALGVIAGGIAWWQMDIHSRQALLSRVDRFAVWAGIVLLVPWIAFSFIAWVERRKSNLSAGILIVAMTAAEIAALVLLFGPQWSGTAQWMFLILNGLIAGAYNLFTCDWIAERMES